jgi:hypothetical protein
MKRSFICLLMGVLILAFSSYSRGQEHCSPAESVGTNCCDAGGQSTQGYSVDLGSCDTLHVVPLATTDTCIIYAYHFTEEPESDYTDTICINNPGSHFPCFVYLNLLVTHDSNTFWWENPPNSKWVQDSISSIVVPLGWTRTNQAQYCSLSTYWNENTVDADEYPPGLYPRRIWRNFPPLGGDSINLMGKLKWNTMIVGLSSDSVQVSGAWTPPHAFITLIAGQNRKKWSQQKDTLLATLTFRVEDTMTICIDTTSIPPGYGTIQFVRYDAGSYIPRSKMPFGIRVASDGSVETCEACAFCTSGVRWIDGSTEENKPTTFHLSQNYPNPFNPVTNFKFSLPQASHVKIEIFNILGQKVKTLVDQDMKAGSFAVDWDGQDQRGKEVSSGIYFYRMTAGDFSSVKRMVLLK